LSIAGGILFSLAFQSCELRGKQNYIVNNDCLTKHTNMSIDNILQTKQYSKYQA